MVDKVTVPVRSSIMRRVKSKNTKPELELRSLLHRSGFRFGIHKKSLPGSPDIYMPKYKTVIFVHGCFWHRHKNCSRASTPTSNVSYWENKFKRNIERDNRNILALRQLGWNVLIVWECEMKKNNALVKKLSLKIRKNLFKVKAGKKHV